MLKFSAFVTIFQLYALVSNWSGVQSFATPRSDFMLTVDENSVAVAHNHGCLLEQKLGQDFGGKAYCWGADDYGKIDSPSNITFVQIITGMSFSCGITLEQTALCWGQFGGYKPGMYMQLTAGSEANFACGVTNDGRINCWGSNVVSKMPLGVVPEVKYVQISCSAYHCCALDANAYPHCWGNGVEAKDIPTITQSEYHESVRTNGRSLLSMRNSQTAEEEEDEEEVLRRQARRGSASASGGAKKTTSSSGGDDDAQENDDFNEVISKIQFRQLSVSDGFTCGVMLLGSHLRCWGHEKLSYQQLLPKFVLGPFRQVSVGGGGICVIAGEASRDEQSAHIADAAAEKEVRVHLGRKYVDDVKVKRGLDEMTCWGTSRANPDAFAAWDSISLGGTFGCGVSMDSELNCFGAMLGDQNGRNFNDIIVA